MKDIYQLKLNVVNGIDLFTHKKYSELLIRAIRHYQKSYGLQIYGYVVMPATAHLLAAQPEGVLREVVHSLKGYTSAKLVEIIQKSNDPRRGWILNAFSTAGLNKPEGDFFELWTGNNDWEPVSSPTDLEQRLDLIHGIPVRAGFVSQPEHYRFSSASGAGNPDEKDLVVTGIEPPETDTALNLAIS